MDRKQWKGSTQLSRDAYEAFSLVETAFNSFCNMAETLLKFVTQKWKKSHFPHTFGFYFMTNGILSYCMS